MPAEAITHQVVISGIITDAVSERRPRTLPTITVVDPGSGQPIDGLTVRVGADGRFAVDGDPGRVLPPEATDVRLEVRAEGYSGSDHTVAFTEDDLARVSRPVRAGDETVAVDVIAAPPRSVDLALDPLPVALLGRVTAHEDPAVPIPGATVTITGPSPVPAATTDGDGYYAIGSTPVAAEITVSVQAAGRKAATETVRLDHGNPMNRAGFVLEKAT